MKYKGYKKTNYQLNSDMKKFLVSFAFIAAALFPAFGQWSPAGDNIRTPWASEISPDAMPLEEYPRPQMVRAQWANLNGLWNYAICDSSAEVMPASQGRIMVPFAIESSLSGVGKWVSKDQALWYERKFTLARAWKGCDVLLHFGAVDWHTEVYVNDVLVGEHKGGYDPFSFDITPYLRKSGAQSLKVKVTDATDNSFQPRGKQCLINRGIWYTPVTGIWQTVWLEPVPKTRIDSFCAQGDLASSSLTVDVSTKGLAEGDVVKVSLLEGGEGYSAEKPGSQVLAQVEASDGKAVLQVPDVKTWSPDSPYLYGLRLTVERKGKVIDSVDGYTAMRSISVIRDSSPNKYRRMALNGEGIFMFGPLDQGWWPDGLYTAPTDEALKFDIVKTKEMGYNMIRKHIKVEPARWYYWCDVLGMMVWQDMPCIGDHDKKQMPARDPEVVAGVSNVWGRDSFTGGTDCVIPQEWKDNYYAEWTAIINSLKCFQSIVVWVPFNEAWGQFDTEAVVDYTRGLDSTRLINAASGGNLHFCGDILDVHHYPCPAMNAFDRKFVNVLGEYGGIGYPVEGHLWQIEDKWGYGGVKKSFEEVLTQYADFADMLKVFVQTGCAAAVYTQTTDVEGEVNGLITYDREVVKVDEAKIAEINRSVIASMAK